MLHRVHLKGPGGESELIRRALLTAYSVHGIRGSAEDFNIMLDAQDQVQLFPETEAALQAQQDLASRS